MMAYLTHIWLCFSFCDGAVHMSPRKLGPGWKIEGGCAPPGRSL